MEEFALEPGEKIAKQVRQHVVIIVVQLLGFLLLGIFPLLIPLILGLASVASQGATDSLVQFVSLNNPWIRFGLGLWWLALWIAAFTTFTRYYLTVWVITTTRIVDIHQRGLFNRTVSSTLLARVQDITTGVDGLFATLFGFGSLMVQTAGAQEELRMEGIAGPEHLRDFIMKEIADLHAKGTGV